MKLLRKTAPALALALALACAATPAAAAGFQRIDVPADARGPALHGAVWYPCDAAATAMDLDVITIHAARGCRVRGDHLPLIVVSHGTGGSMLGHHDTAEALADAGFVVAAINHPGDNFQDASRQQDLSSFQSRPIDIRRLIDFMLADWSGHRQLDPGAVGMFGFSRGGYTALVVAGAVPDFRLGRRFCVDQPGMPFCSEIAAPGALALPPAARDARVRAAVVVDPLSLFTGEGLAAVRIPVQLWASERGGDGVLPHDVEAIRRSLPQPPEHHAVPLSGHFVFLAPCSPAQARQMPVLCADDPGFDRQAFHRSFDAKVVAFFRAHLLPAPR